MKQNEANKLTNKSDPNDVQLTDLSGRSGMNSVFGDAVVGTRIAQVSGQFKYGLPTNASKANIVSTGTIVTHESLLVISSGTATDGLASIANRRPIRYIPGYDTFCLWTADFTPGVPDSYQRTGLFDDNDGFFIGYEGEVFGFTRRRLGVDNFSPINIEIMKTKYCFDIDLTKGNIYRLNYGYLGFATVIIEILHPEGYFVPLFKLKYPNTSSDSHITQTFLEPRIDVANTGNNTDLTVRVGSFNAGIIDGGGQTPSTRDFAHAGTFGPLTGNQDIIAYRNKSIFNTFENKVPSQFTWLSLAVEGNKPFIVELILNPTEVTPGTWTDVDTPNSTNEYSTDTVWDTDGKLLFPFSLAKVGDIGEIIKELKIEWLPTDVILVRLITASTGYDATIGVKWDELF